MARTTTGRRALEPAATAFDAGVVARALILVSTAMLLAFVRLRTSPLYPRFNAPNSDFFVYQTIGYSWIHGQLPYRDVFDIKGPFLYFLFALFSRVGGLSVWPPLVALTLFACATAGLGFELMRRAVASPWRATPGTVVVMWLIYLSPGGVSSSFTCEEMAVPGVVLLLWLARRWLRDGERVNAWWWLLDGVVLGALFWSKYLVVVPWIALLAWLAGQAAWGRGVDRREVSRILALHGLGVLLTTAFVLPWYRHAWPQMFHAYFLAKRSALTPRTELVKEVAYLGHLGQISPGSLAVLLAMAVVCVWCARRRPSAWATTLAFTYALSLWASIVVVRHPYNSFVPLSFIAVALPPWLGGRATRGRTLVAALVCAAVCTAPVVESVQRFRLGASARPVTCHDYRTGRTTVADTGVTATFAQVASGHPVMSLGDMYAARIYVLTGQPSYRLYSFVDSSWARDVGADVVQDRYLRERTFEYVWLHLADSSLPTMKAIPTAGHPLFGVPEVWTTTLADNYRPVLRCDGTQVLFRHR